jgi:hypothetical protein
MTPKLRIDPDKHELVVHPNMVGLADGFVAFEKTKPIGKLDLERVLPRKISRPAYRREISPTEGFFGGRD